MWKTSLAGSMVTGAYTAAAVEPLDALELPEVPASGLLLLLLDI